MTQLTPRLTLIGGKCKNCELRTVVNRETKSLKCPQCGNANGLGQLFDYLREECDLSIADWGDGTHLLDDPTFGFRLVFEFAPVSGV